LRKLKVSAGMHIAIIRTYMRQVGGKWWTLGS